MSASESYVIGLDRQAATTIVDTRPTTDSQIDQGFSISSTRSGSNRDEASVHTSTGENINISIIETN